MVFISTGVSGSTTGTGAHTAVGRGSLSARCLPSTGSSARLAMPFGSEGDATSR